jgi:FtsH-binding integral membrane protein
MPIASPGAAVKAAGLVETLKGQRAWAGVAFVGFLGLLLAGITDSLSGTTVVGLTEANAEHGGNVQGIGVLIFAGLTAYDTQRLKEEYVHLRGTEYIGKAVIMGALNLYLDFINMFTVLLRFLGNRE